MLSDRLRGHDKEEVSGSQLSECILPDNIPLEFQVLLSACRAFLGTEDPERLEALLQQGPNWDRLPALASRHGVMPLLYRSLGKIERQTVPQETVARLRMLYMQNAARNIQLTRELLRQLDLFEARGIQAIPFKGPTLAQAVYGDITLRMFSDLDIIVLKQDVLRAKEILLSEGYKPEFQLNLDQEKWLLKSNCEYNFYHKARGANIEVHWQLAWSGHNLGFDAEGIWSRTCKMAIEGRNVLMLSPEDLLMALCIHAARHCWYDDTLKMICDVAGLIDTNNNLNWNNIESCACDLRARRILLLGLKLAGDVFGAKLPEGLSYKADSDPAVKMLATNVCRHLFSGSQTKSRLWEEISFWSLARESPRDRLRCIMGLALETTPRDWMQVNLPASLYPLYSLIRLARIISEFGFESREIDE